MKKLTVSILIFMSTVTLAFSKNLDNLKIGLVSPVEVYETVPQGVQSIQDLHVKLDPEINELQRKQQSLVEKIQILQTDAPTLTESELNVQQRFLADEQEKLKQEVINFRQSEIEQEQNIIQDFELSFNKAVSSIASEEKYSLILSLQGILYVDSNLKIDITDQVISKMEEQYIY